MKLREIAARLGCRAARRRRDRDYRRGRDGARRPGRTDFPGQPEYAPKVKQTRAARHSDQPSRCATCPSPAWSRRTRIWISRARWSCSTSRRARRRASIRWLRSLPTAVIGEGASIGPFAVVGESVIIGRNAVLHPHVVIYEEPRSATISWPTRTPWCGSSAGIGNRVILQNGVVVGGDGFGFAKQADGTHYKIVQSGPTVIEDDVEIQSLTSVDRATVGETRIKRGAKIDSLVQIGHACVVGEDNIICAQTGLAGSSHPGEERAAGGTGGDLRPSDHSRECDCLRAERHRRGRGGGSVISGRRPSRPPCGARRVGLSEAAGTVKTVRELKKHIEELEAAPDTARILMA